MIARRRPTIAVTVARRARATWLLFASQVWRAGGRPVRVCPGERAPTRFDGLVVGGGSNLEARHWIDRLVDPAPTSPAHLAPPPPARWAVAAAMRAVRARIDPAGVPDARRDALEFRLLGRALRRRVPVLGVCRGAQLLNVHLGGTLHADLRRARPTRPARATPLPTWRAHVAPYSRLAALFGERVAINMLHRQAIRDVAPALSVAAVDSHSVVQAVEQRGVDWVVGVQWHPELLFYRREQRALVAALVGRASARSG